MLVRAVADDGPAAQAGIDGGDMIVAVGDRDIEDIDHLHDAMETITRSASLKQVQKPSI